MDASRGVPLLSGPIPDSFTIDERAEMSCRKCNKEFNLLFARGRRCEHCGYQYCNSCSDFQALMPRTGFGTGYDSVAVCAFCIQYLQITAGGKAYLRTLPLAKLKNYMQSYALRLGPNVIEKEDVINAIVDARGNNGCLPSYHEDFYRKNAVPNGQTSRPRGMFSRAERNPIPQQHLDPGSEWRDDSGFARPDLEELAQEQARERDQSNQSAGQAPRTNPPPGQADARPRVPSSGMDTSNSFPSQTQPNQYAPPPGPPPSFSRSQSQSAYPPNSTPFNAGPYPNTHTYATPRYQFPHPQTPYYPQYSPYHQFRPQPQPYQPPPQQFQNPSPQWQSRPQTSVPPHPQPPSYGPYRSYDYPYSPPPGQSRQDPSERRPSTQFTPRPSTHSSPSPQPPRPTSTNPNSSGRSSPHRRTTSLHSDSPPRASSRPSSSAPHAPASSAAAVPSLEELLETDEESLIHLPVSTLKSILFSNHVNIGSLPILEKGELVERVKLLLDAERREQVRAEAVREREEWEKAEKEWAEREARKEREESERRARRDRFRATVEDENASESSEDIEPSRMDVDVAPINTDAILEVNEDIAPFEPNSTRAGVAGQSSTSSNEETRPSRQPPFPDRARSSSPPSKFSQERNGLCVVCQDDESNIVIVDCGHLALCRGCADLIWASSRECPLCRTRIITEARMLRVFKS